MADVTTTGKVTVFGAAGNVAFTGVIASADMVSMAFSDNFTVTEQENSEGNAIGAVAHDQRYDFVLTFYPVPVTQDATGWKAIALPAVFATVAVARKSPLQNAAENVPTQLIRNFQYVGGGRMEFTQSGLMVMTLPLRRWAGITPS